MESLTFTVIIPARMRSTRLPGKMLADIGGKPLVAWVAERARESGAARVVIATDHGDIEKAALAHGWSVCRTSPDTALNQDAAGAPRRFRTRSRSAAVSTPASNGRSQMATAMRWPWPRARSCSSASKRSASVCESVA